MYAYMDASWFLSVLLIVLLPALVVFVLELIFAAVRPTENAWLRIAGERLARGEIDKAQLRVLLNAL
jgi:uncharacterized membrane protein